MKSPEHSSTDPFSDRTAKWVNFITFLNLSSLNERAFATCYSYSILVPFCLSSPLHHWGILQMKSISDSQVKY